MNAKTVELHLIQSFPPSCVNRDGNNSPKDCTFGDVRRARISSQSMKRATRNADSFAETLGEETATRSKQMRDKKLVPYLIGQGLSQQEAEAATDKFMPELAKFDSKKPQNSSVGLYFGDQELFSLLNAHRSGEKDWKDKGHRKSADVALFGRMLAEATDLNVDAAAQVAHAISTHRLSQEMDYWTAADDLKDQSEGEDAGAGMLGTAEFNASVFYRYSCVSLPILTANLGDEEFAKKTIEAFLLASYDAIPTGKLNGHAHFTPPIFAMAVVRRKGMPLNLVNAFISPVKPTKDADIAIGSVQALESHLAKMRQMAPVDDATYIYATALDGEFSGAERASGYADLVKRILGEL
jgi:CRISPR system Cascade subunit CasC